MVTQSTREGADMAPTEDKDAESACAELREALKAAGVCLPSLGLDITSYAWPGPPTLINLGRCNAKTAHALAAALRPATRTTR
jgi:hypothetical protein